MAQSNRSSVNSGFTLIEMMVAIAVFTVLLIGVLNLLDNSTRISKIEAALAEFEEAPGSGSGSLERGSWRLTKGIREDVDQLDKPPAPIDGLEELSFTPWDVELAHKGVHRPLELSFGEVDALIARDPDNGELIGGVGRGDPRATACQRGQHPRP